MRLFVQIFLLVALSAMIAALAMAGLTSLSLSRGFSAYIEDRDNQRLSEFVAEAEAILADNPETGLKEIVMLVPDPRPDRPANVDGEPPLPRRLDGQARRPAAVVRPPRPNAQAPSRERLPPPNFLPRVSIYDADGKRLAGPPLRPGGKPAVRRPLLYNGTTMGEVVLLPIGPSPAGIETAFLRDQFIGIGILVLAIIALAAIAALFIARRGAVVLADIGRVANGVTHGDFSQRATVRGNGELSDLAANVNYMAETLGELQQARHTWLAEVGHELRTPLTVLQGELEALREGIRPLDADAVQSLDEEASRLSLLIDDLQFMAMSNMARPTFVFGAIPLAEVIGKAERRFSERCSAAGHSLVVRNTAPQSTIVHWDEARIDQLLANLISNSSAYTDAPGTIRITASLDGENVRLSFEDSAPGVAKEDLGRLFDPLFRAEKSRSRNLGGSGLGLAVCAVITGEHGGTIRAQPSPLGGLEVIVTLPTEQGRQNADKQSDEP